MMFVQWLQQMRFKMKIILLSLLVVLSGCADYRALVGSRGAEAADVALQDAEWVVCKASTAGALERKYALYSDTGGPKAISWRGLCYGVGE